MPIINKPQEKVIKWDLYQEELLRTLYNKHNSITEIAHKMNRSVKSIQQKAGRLNLVKETKEITNNIEYNKNIIIDYCKYRMSLSDISNKYNYSIYSIKNFLGERILSFQDKEKIKLEMIKKKRCINCLKVQSIDCFYKQVAQCKTCYNAKKNIYKKRYRKSMSKEQKEKQYKYFKEWKNNKIKEDPQYKEKLKTIKKRSVEKLKKNDLERYLEYKNTNKLNNKLRNKNILGSHTTKEWRELKKQLGDQCLCCKRTKEKLESSYGENRSPLQRDHIVPISLGGTNYITNIQILCDKCNNVKSGYIYDYRPKDLQKYHIIDQNIIKYEIQRMKLIINHLEGLLR